MSINKKDSTDHARYEFRYTDKYDIFSTKKGLCVETIEEMSQSRREPYWLREFRLRSYDVFINKSIPNTVCDPLKIDFQNIYYSAAFEKEDIKLDYGGFSTDKSQVPIITQRERESFIETDTQNDTEAVCHHLSEKLQKMGVIFVDMDTAIKNYPELFEKHFGRVIPPEDNKIAALNGVIWSSGSFMYVPPDVKVSFPVYSNYRINMENTDQFERNLIIADEGSEVHYIEVCPSRAYTRTVGSLRSLATELIAKKCAKIRYTAIQNWRKDVYNLVAKRAYVYENATVEWIDGSLGSKLTMECPSIYLLGRNAIAKIVSLAFAGPGQHQDVGAKAVHLAPDTTSKIATKSISKSDGRTTFKGLLHIGKGSIHAKADIQFDALILDENSGINVYPCIEVNEENSISSYESVIRKVGTDQMFYLMSRGYSESDALSMIVTGFIESFMKELPVECAVELSRFIRLELEGKSRQH